MAYGELTAFSRLAGDADLAPSITAKAALARLAVAEFGHFGRLCDRVTQLGGDPDAAMRPFVAAIDAFHERTAPRSWLEGLVKAYVGDNIAADFYREISAFVDDATRELIVAALEDTGQAEFVVSTVRAAIDADPRLAGPLALWARRLVGEALGQAQQVAAERDALTMLLIGGVGRPGADLGEVARMFRRITEAHTRRMGLLGLSG
jgi:hypothetical protein